MGLMIATLLYAAAQVARFADRWLMIAAGRAVAANLDQKWLVNPLLVRLGARFAQRHLGQSAPG